MQKGDSLRAALTAVYPEFGRDADRLKLWVDEGRIRAPMTASRAFTYEYKLTLELVAFTGHPSVIFLAINDWLRVNQPDLVAGGAQGYTFEAEVIDDKTVDLLITLPLTEQVILLPREGGGWNLQHLAEPDPLFPDETQIGEALLKQIWWKDELLVE